MRLRDIQIGMRNIGTKGRASNPNGQYVSDPRPCWVTPLKPVAPDPLNRTCPAENGGQQIAHGWSSIFLSPSAVRIVVPVRKQ